MDISKMTKAQLVALLANAPQPSQPVAPPVVASLAIPDAAWNALESAVIGSFDNHSRDTTFLGAVLTFAQAVPSDWRGKPLPTAVVDTHADNVKSKLLATYGDTSALPKEDQDRIKRTCDQKHSRAKALFTCSTILAQAYEQGFKGGVVEAGKLATELKDANYSLAAVMAARAAAANAVPDFLKVVAKAIDGILNTKPEGDTVPLCLNAKAKAQLVKWADDHGLTLKHGQQHRNNPLAIG